MLTPEQENEFADWLRFAHSKGLEGRLELVRAIARECASPPMEGAAPSYEAEHVSLKQKDGRITLTLVLDAVEGAPRYLVTPVNPAVVRTPPTEAPAASAGQLSDDVATLSRLAAVLESGHAYNGIADDNARIYAEALRGILAARSSSPVDSVPTFDEIADVLPNLPASSQCPLCGRDYLHEHSPEEIIIYRNGVKWGARNGGLSWKDHQGAPQDARADTTAIGGSRKAYEDEHLQYRVGQADPDGNDAKRNSGSARIQGDGQVRMPSIADESSPVESGAVAWANVREDGVIVGLSQHSEDIARWQNPRPLYTAPPAQAGEPKLTDTAWLEKQLRELYRVTANRTCGWMTFVKIGVALLAASDSAKGGVA